MDYDKPHLSITEKHLPSVKDMKLGERRTLMVTVEAGELAKQSDYSGMKTLSPGDSKKAPKIVHARLIVHSVADHTAKPGAKPKKAQRYA